MVKLEVFLSVTMDFLITGHTGNEVDQIFSILANEFKSEIRTVEELVLKMVNAPIDPKPVVHHQNFIWDWKKYVEDSLYPLENHSVFNSFEFQKESGEVRFRYKKLPQDPEYGPKSGLMLVKDTFHLQEPVPVADLRLEKLELDKLLRNLEPFFKTIPLPEQMGVRSKWEQLKKSLEALPAQSNTFEKMEISTLPKNTPRPESGNLDDTQNQEEIRGRYHHEYVDDGDLQEELQDGTDVCIYTASKRSRPWVGRVLKTYPEEGEFEVQWYEKDKSSKHGRYIAMTYPNDAPYVSRMPYSTVMVWSFTEQRGEFEFVISSYWQQYLKSEYEKLDA